VLGVLGVLGPRPRPRPKLLELFGLVRPGFLSLLGPRLVFLRLLRLLRLLGPRPRPRPKLLELFGLVRLLGLQEPGLWPGPKLLELLGPRLVFLRLLGLLVIGGLGLLGLLHPD